jgi:hypothetical protein
MAQIAPFFFMSTKSSIGVVLPTLNCAHMLLAHLESMEAWLDVVSEIIVVDSYSCDGTMEIIRERLKHPGVRLHSHPRGLYQSWNFGISQLRTKYAYISTVGDSITRAGLQHLLEIAERQNSDVAVSRPRFISNDGESIDDEIHWPIDDVLSTLRIAEPTALEGLRLFYFTYLHSPCAVLGSSASNLYRTEILQRRPFPTDFGTTGDTAWGIANVFDSRLCVTREVFSTFRFHPKSYPTGEYTVTDITAKLSVLASDTLQARLDLDADLRDEIERLGCDRLPQLMNEHLEWCRRLEAAREGKVPWIFNPAAWYARANRDRTLRLAHQRKRELIRLFGVG